MTDIDYGKIIKRSFELTKKHKWLWVYGLIISIFAGGGGSSFGNGFSSGGKSSSVDQLPKEIPKELPQNTSEVLGQMTSAFGDFIKNVSPQTWILLGLGIFLLIIFSMVVTWVISAWAKGALIAGLEKADKEESPNLLNTSVNGISSIKRLVFYQVIVSLLMFASIFGLIIIFTVPAIIFPGILKVIWIILVGLIGGLTLVALTVLLTMAGIYSERLIVLYNYKPWPALVKGFGLGKNNFLPTVLMGVINLSVGCAVGCLGTIALLIFLGIPALIVIVPLFVGGFHFPGLPAALFLGLLFLIFIYLNYLIRAVLIVFNYSNWNLFFKEFFKEEENGQK